MHRNSQFNNEYIVLLIFIVVDSCMSFFIILSLIVTDIFNSKNCFLNNINKQKILVIKCTRIKSKFSSFLVHVYLQIQINSHAKIYFSTSQSIKSLFSIEIDDNHIESIKYSLQSYSLQLISLIMSNIQKSFCYIFMRKTLYNFLLSGIITYKCRFYKNLLFDCKKILMLLSDYFCY